MSPVYLQGHRAPFRVTHARLAALIRGHWGIEASTTSETSPTAKTPAK
jgi:hypothetical protein